jgi:hypothetical protein
MKMPISCSEEVANAPLFVNYNPIPSKYESESRFWGVASRTKGIKVTSSTARMPWKISIKKRKSFWDELLYFKEVKDAARVASYLHKHKDINKEQLIARVIQSYNLGNSSDAPLVLD